MIDLNCRQKDKQDDEPVGTVILTLIPFVIMFFALIEMGL